MAKKKLSDQTTLEIIEKKVISGCVINLPSGNIVTLEFENDDSVHYIEPEHIGEDEVIYGELSICDRYIAVIMNMEDKEFKDMITDLTELRKAHHNIKNSYDSLNE
jgi:hypothetical protein